MFTKHLRMLSLLGIPLTCPTPFVGSGWSQGTYIHASIMNHTYALDYDAMSHSALGGSTKIAVASLVLKNIELWGSFYWNTGLIIQNTSSGSSASGAVYLYTSTGAWEATILRTIPANGTRVIHPLPVNDGFAGSAWVLADQNISVSATHATPATSSDDTAFSYSVVNR